MSVSAGMCCSDQSGDGLLNSIASAINSICATSHRKALRCWSFIAAEQHAVLVQRVNSGKGAAVLRDVLSPIAALHRSPISLQQNAIFVATTLGVRRYNRDS